MTDRNIRLNWVFNLENSGQIVSDINRFSSSLDEAKKEASSLNDFLSRISVDTINAAVIKQFASETKKASVKIIALDEATKKYNSTLKELVSLRAKSAAAASKDKASAFLESPIAKRQTFIESAVKKDPRLTPETAGKIFDEAERTEQALLKKKYTVSELTGELAINEEQLKKNEAATRRQAEAEKQSAAATQYYAEVQRVAREAGVDEHTAKFVVDSHRREMTRIKARTVAYEGEGEAIRRNIAAKIEIERRQKAVASGQALGLSKEDAGRIFDNYKKEQAQLQLSTHYFNEKTESIEKMSMAQKIAAGQWQSAFPALNKLNNALNTVRWSMVNVAFAIGALAIIASPFILLTRQGIEYEEQLRQIAAVSGEVYQSIEGRRAISSAVAGVAIGRPTTFKEAATAMLEFQRAGFTLSESIRDVPHIIDLSVAGFVELEKATKIVASVLHQFSAEGISAAKATDVIAKAAVSSATTVEEFGNALSYVGPLAASVGISFMETAAALALLSNAGMRGSRAGTTLRQVLAKISSVSRQGEESMMRMGVSFFTAEGHTKSLQEIMTSLHVSMRNMTDQQKQLFISEMFEIRSKAGIAALLNMIEQNVTAIDDFVNVLDQAGFASRTAADIQAASALRMRTAWGNLMIALQPLAMDFQNMFSTIIESVEDFSSRMVIALRKSGWQRFFAVSAEIPLTAQIVALGVAIKAVAVAFNVLTSRLKAFVVAQTAATAVTKLTNTERATSLFFLNAEKIALAANNKAIYANTLANFKARTALIAKTFAVNALAAAKLFLVGAINTATVAVKAFYLALGPVGIALLAVGGSAVALFRGWENISKLTEQQEAVLHSYTTAIDDAIAKEQAYTNASLSNAAARESAFAQEMIAKREEAEETMRALSRAESAADINLRWASPQTAGEFAENVFRPTGLSGWAEALKGVFTLDWGTFTDGLKNSIGPINILKDSFASIGGEISAFRQLGASDWWSTLSDPEARRELIIEKQEELLEKERSFIAEQRRLQSEREDATKFAVASLSTFVKNLESGEAVLESYAQKELASAIRRNENYGEIVESLKEQVEVQKLIDAEILSEEEGRARLEPIHKRILHLLGDTVDELDMVEQGYHKIMSSSNQATRVLQAEADNLRVAFEGVAEAVKSIFDNMAPQASRIFSEFGDTDRLFGTEGALENLIRVHGTTEAQRELVSGLKDKIRQYDILDDRLRVQEMRHARVTTAITRQENAIKAYEIAISALNEQLKIHDDMISKLSSQRFIGETDVDKLMHSISQNIKRAELETWGIVDVVGFLEDAVSDVDGTWDGVLSKMREVEEASSKSQNQYEAWRKTVQAHIRGLIVEGNNLAKQTTDAVRRHKTMLLEVSRFDGSSRGGKTDDELRLEALRAAYDYHYGGMHEDVKLAIQANEDLAAVHNESSETIIKALQAEWKARKPIIAQIKQKESAIEDLRQEIIYQGMNLAQARTQQQRYANQIENIVNQITGEGGLIASIGELILKNMAEEESTKSLRAEIDRLTRSYQQMNAAKSGRSRSTSGTASDPHDFTNVTVPINFTPVDTSQPGWSVTNPTPPTLTFAGVGTPTPAPLLPRFDDFVWRPGSDPIGFSKDDTLIGVKDVGDLGKGVVIHNINVSSNTGNPKALAKQLAQEIKRELRAV